MATIINQYITIIDDGCLKTFGSLLRLTSDIISFSNNHVNIIKMISLSRERLIKIILYLNMYSLLVGSSVLSFIYYYLIEIQKEM
jgi:hypothetical protein